MSQLLIDPVSLRRAAALYQKRLAKYPAVRNGPLYAHLRWLCEQIMLNARDDRVAANVQAQRLLDAWHQLGFVQGAFWVLGDFTLDELRAHRDGYVESDIPEEGLGTCQKPE
jgi:hypothetical protein